MSVTPDSFLEQLLDEKEQARVQNQESREDRVLLLRRQLVSLLGDFGVHHSSLDGLLEPTQGIDPCPLDPVVIERMELEEVVRERVEYSTMNGLRMLTYVVIPKTRPAGVRLPAVVLWHGHGYGSKSMVGLKADNSPVLEEKLSDNLALALARRGSIAFAPEIVGFGDRRLDRDIDKKPDIANSCFNLSVSLLMAGKTTAGLRTMEAIRTVDYAMTRPEVDTQRLGTMGFSGGGTVSMLLAALDTRVKASVVGIYANTFRNSLLLMTHCLCNYIPHALESFEMPDLLELIAPRSLFIEAGSLDPIFPLPGTQEAIQRVSEVYHHLGIPERFGYHIHDGGHEVNGTQSLDWLVTELVCRTRHPW